MKIIINWFIAALAIIVAAYLLPGVEISGFLSALVVAVVIGGINAFLRPILFIVTLPITIITFGLFILILNALLILLAAAIVPGFQVDGFWWALLFSVVLYLVNSVFGAFERKEIPHA